jgi:hypothetical protein
MRARELELAEEQEQAREAERKMREQQEQEKRFYQKLNIEKQWKAKQNEAR